MVSQVSIDKMKITEVAKVGDVISVKMNTRLSKNSEGIKNADITIVFDKGGGQIVNPLTRCFHI